MLNETGLDAHVPRVTCVGEIDVSIIDALRDALDTAASVGRGLCVDLSQTTFIDSSGIAELVRAGRAAQTSDQIVTVLVPQPFMRRVFALMNVDTVLSIEPPLAPSDRTLRGIPR